MITARHDSGFSLIEVMVAILIMGVSLVGLVHGVNTALASSKEAEIQSIAANLAAGQIEALRAQFSISEVADSGDGEFAGALSNYSWRQTVAATPTEGFFEVTVAIEESGTGREIYELKTMLFDPPYIESDASEKEEQRRKRNR